MKLFVLTTLVVAFIFTFANGKVFLEKEESSQYLRRAKRGYSPFEELHQGNIERECVEEMCDHEEAREAFEDDTLTENYWTRLTGQCSTSLNLCNETGTDHCKNKYDGFSCVCSPGYVGEYCETETNECDLGYCPIGSECIDLVNAFRCVCPSSGCLSFSDETNTVP